MNRSRDITWHRGVLAVALLSLMVGAISAAEKKAEKISLFNGRDLTGWKTFLAPDAAEKDPHKVWQVSDGVIHCAGKPAGYLLSNDEFADYILRLEWRWPSDGGNSGVFVHVVGPDQIWPKGIEAQLMAEHAGDFWLVDGAKLTIDPARQDKKVARHFYRVEAKQQIEKPLGQWNQYEITCKGDTIKLVVNGHEVNEGTQSELTKGRILLQSEGTPIEFRNIEIEPLP